MIGGWSGKASVRRCHLTRYQKGKSIQEVGVASAKVLGWNTLGPFEEQKRGRC